MGQPAVNTEKAGGHRPRWVVSEVVWRCTGLATKRASMCVAPSMTGEHITALHSCVQALDREAQTLGANAQ